MISLDKIERAILEHESMDTTYANCEKLAMLYIVRDHLAGQSTDALALPDTGGGESDFLRAAAECGAAAAWTVMDEMMEALRICQPRAYQGVMRKLIEAKQ